MLIESAALYATWSVVFIILYVMDNPGQYVMLLTLCNVQVICPVLIVYRVSRGLGWEETTSAKLASMSRMSFAQRQVASVTTLETPDTPENQQEKIPDMVPTSPSRRAARPEAA
ncbi:hypothetical protein HD554DRAFT_2142283 [Boletus coccyginus]|nr:hypothetical protein HD554DRAFT_2142283 [Boletus coccyginus]